MVFDPLYILVAAPFMLLGLYAQFKVKSSFARFSRVAASSRMSGAEAASLMLRQAGIQNVRIEPVAGHLSDHYDPLKRVIRLSPDVYGSHSLAAVGVACHEVGHAIQHAKAYAPLVIRNVAVPAANIGSSAGMLLFMLGLFLSMPGLAWLGLILFSFVVLFQLINLPVEFDASNRAKRMLVSMGVVTAGAESRAVAKVLNAAALTYVAATLQSIATLAYFALRLLGNRR